MSQLQASFGKSCTGLRHRVQGTGGRVRAVTLRVLTGVAPVVEPPEAVANVEHASFLPPCLPSCCCCCRCCFLASPSSSASTALIFRARCGCSGRVFVSCFRGGGHCRSDDAPAGHRCCAPPRCPRGCVCGGHCCSDDAPPDHWRGAPPCGTRRPHTNTHVGQQGCIRKKKRSRGGRRWLKIEFGGGGRGPCSMSPCMHESTSKDEKTPPCLPVHVLSGESVKSLEN